MKRFALPWSAVAMMGLATGACATSGHFGLERDGTQQASRIPSWRVERDSVAAQAIADEVGPRVTIRATMDHAAGSRRVEASFHMYDDAYVIVGHLDAGGRMRVVFPLEPGDDGFVKADKIYHVPTFFAGFADEYRWRYTESRQRYRSAASRFDSYDAGFGYVFVIASWRPMRLDRISDGDRWENYEIADINYMYDPREAIEELGGLIAGDNREAYTIEYAHYTTTNYGTYSMSSFSRCFDPVFGYAGFGFGYGSFAFSPFVGFGYSPIVGSASACGYARYYYYPRYATGYAGYTPGVNAPPIVTPPVIVPPTRGSPIARRPRFPGDTATGTVIGRRPRQEATEQQGAQNSGYRRRGLVAEDATPPRRGQAVRRAPMENGAGDDARRPGLHEMIGAGRIRETPRTNSGGGFSGGYRQPSDESIATGRTYRGGVSQPSDDDRGGGRSAPAGRIRGDDGGRPGGYSEPRGERMQPRHESPRDEGTRSSPPPRAEPQSPPPAPPPRSEPASTGGSDRRKPGA